MNDGYGTTTTTGPYNHTLTLMTLSIIDVDMHSLIDSFGLNDVIYIYIYIYTWYRYVKGDTNTKPTRFYIVVAGNAPLGFRIYILNRHK